MGAVVERTEVAFVLIGLHFGQRSFVWSKATLQYPWETETMAFLVTGLAYTGTTVADEDATLVEKLLPERQMADDF